MSRTIRASTLIALSLTILSVLLFVLRPDSLAAEPQAKTLDIRVESNSMTPEEVEVNEGDRVALRIASDEAAEFHIHGYDLEREVEPSETSTLSFTADITGRFDIESHPAHAGEHSHDGSDGHDHSHGGGTLTVLPR